MQRVMRLLIVLVVSAHSIAAFGQAQPKDEKAAVATAIKSIPYAKEFLDLYPNATVSTCKLSAICGTFTDEEAKEIQDSLLLYVTTGLYSRYVFTMSVQFKMTPDLNTVTMFKEPDFRVREIESIKFVLPCPGSPQFKAETSSTPFLSEFNHDKFKVLKAHHGDFSAIGVTISTNAAVKEFGRMWKNGASAETLQGTWVFVRDRAWQLVQ